MVRSNNVFKQLVPCSIALLAFRALLLGVNCNCDNFVQATDTSCLGSSLKTHQLSSFRGGATVGSDTAVSHVPGEKIYRTLQGKRV